MVDQVGLAQGRIVAYLWVLDYVSALSGAADHQALLSQLAVGALGRAQGTVPVLRRLAQRGQALARLELAFQDVLAHRRGDLVIQTFSVHSFSIWKFAAFASFFRAAVSKSLKSATIDAGGDCIEDYSAHC